MSPAEANNGVARRDVQLRRVDSCISVLSCEENASAAKDNIDNTASCAWCRLRRLMCCAPPRARQTQEVHELKLHAGRPALLLKLILLASLIGALIVTALSFNNGARAAAYARAPAACASRAHARSQALTRRATAAPRR